MLKSSAKTYLLLIAVIGVWGTIAYKIVNGLNSDTTEYKTQEIGAFIKPHFHQEIDTFSISIVKRDPFLGTIKSSKKRVQSSKATKKQNVNQKSGISITYQGLVKQQGASQSIFIISINGKQYLAKKGQMIDGVKIKKGNAHQIVVQLNGKNQIISL